MSTAIDDQGYLIGCDEEILARATELVPLLRRLGQQTEGDGRPPEEVIDAVDSAGLFGLTKPSVHGGLETNARTTAETIVELSRGCGSTGWIVTVLTIEQWAISHLPSDGQDIIYSGERGSRTCGTFAPTAKVKKVDGGYTVSGKWAYVSGSLHADWIFAGINVPDESDNVVDFAQALIPMDGDNIHIEKTWDVAGLQGTGSHTVVVDDAFVPDALILSLARANEGGFPAPYPGPLFDAPFLSFANLLQCMPLVGMARAVLELTLERTRNPSRAVPMTVYKEARLAPVIHQLVAEATTLIDTASLHLARYADALDRTAAGLAPAFTLDDKARCRQDVGWITRSCREAITLLMDAQGSSGFMRSNPAQRFWRDCNVASRHALLNPLINQEIYGRQLLGVEQSADLL